MSSIHVGCMWLVTLYNFLCGLILWLSSQISQNIRCCLRGTPKANYRPKKARAFSPIYLSFYKWRKVSGKFFFRGVKTICSVYLCAYLKNSGRKFLLHHSSLWSVCFFFKFLNNWFQRKKASRGRGREKHLFVVPLVYAFIGWFLYVPWSEIKPTMLARQDNTPTNWATQPGLFGVCYEEMRLNTVLPS